VQRTGTRPSDGFVHAMIARAARAVRWASMLIRALVITAGVLCADETPLRVGPGPRIAVLGSEIRGPDGRPPYRGGNWEPGTGLARLAVGAWAV
jgi:hypothetical protein